MPKDNVSCWNLKRLIGQNSAFLKKLNDIATICVHKSKGQSTGSYYHGSTVIAKKLLKLIKMQWINAIQILHQITLMNLKTVEPMFVK